MGDGRPAAEGPGDLEERLQGDWRGVGQGRIVRGKVVAYEGGVAEGLEFHRRVTGRPLDTGPAVGVVGPGQGDAWRDCGEGGMVRRREGAEGSCEGSIGAESRGRGESFGDAPSFLLRRSFLRFSLDRILSSASSVSSSSSKLSMAFGCEASGGRSLRCFDGFGAICPFMWGEVHGRVKPLINDTNIL